MDILVTIDKLTDGWYIRTADGRKDELGGPYVSEALAGEDAVNIGVMVVKPQGQRTVADLTAGALFRAGEYWYRMVRKDGSKKAILTVCGSGDTVILPLNTAVDELSVLSRN